MLNAHSFSPGSSSSPDNLNLHLMDDSTQVTMSYSPFHSPTSPPYSPGSWESLKSGADDEIVAGALDSPISSKSSMIRHYLDEDGTVSDYEKEVVDGFFGGMCLFFLTLLYYAEIL